MIKARGSLLFRAVILFTCIVSFFTSDLPARSLTGDTTIVLWDQLRLDSSYRVDFTRLVIPDARQKYRKITLTYRLECPRFGCDPWDRVGDIWIMDSAKAAPHHTDDLNPLFFEVPRYNMGRFVTPYGKAWSWEFDVTHLRPLLHDSVTFGTYISIFRGTNHHGDAIGYLVSASLHFEEGEPDFVATDVDLLWQGAFPYGNPETPIEDTLKPMRLRVAEDFGVVRVTASGHGQGNTDNAGEFARKLHTLKAGRGTFAHYLWRDDCDKVAAGEQYGSWKYPRAGFCPGSKIYPWVNDVSNFYEPGGELTLDYDVEPYVNECYPGVEPCPCATCEWNDAHTRPHILMFAQLVHYRLGPSTPALHNAFSLKRQGASTLTLIPALGEPTDLTVTVMNAMETVVLKQQFRGVRNRPLDIDLSGTPGRYQLKVETSGGVWREMIEVGGG